MANIITGIRIFCSIALLFLPAFSPAFYTLYVVAGVSDMVDGTVARKTGTVSEFGSKLDTAADFVLVVVCLIKLIPVIYVPTWLIIWIVVIAVIKAVNLVSGYVMRKEIVVLHMGTFGCVPAYDRYFIDGIKDQKVTTGNYNVKSLLGLVDFYEDNRTRLEKTRKALKVYDLPYPQMKLLDMGFWQIGFEKDANKGLQIPH